MALPRHRSGASERHTCSLRNASAGEVSAHRYLHLQDFLYPAEGFACGTSIELRAVRQAGCNAVVGCRKAGNQMIAIVDYGWGNIRAIANIYRRLNIAVSIAASANDLRGAHKVILPGVGAFDSAMQSLNESGMREPLEEVVIGARKPALGICVGMQMLARRSDEGKLSGLGWVDGEVKRFDVSQFPNGTHLPHMGW